MEVKSAISGAQRQVDRTRRSHRSSKGPETDQVRKAIPCSSSLSGSGRPADFPPRVNQSAGLINPQVESLISFRQVCRLPECRGSRGKPIHVSTIWRWAHRGVRGVRLETIRIGGGVYTSAEAIKRFITRLNSENAVAVNPTILDPHRRANQILDEFGV